jgi:hypothetical protein
MKLDNNKSLPIFGKFCWLGGYIITLAILN